MTRAQLFVAAVRRRSVELLVADDTLTLVEAERAAVKELKAQAQLKPRAATPPMGKKAGPGAKARLGTMLSAIASRMTAVIPSSVMAAPPSLGRDTVNKGVAMREETQSASASTEQAPSSEYMLLYTGGAGTAQFIDDEFPQSIATRGWRESIAHNERERLRRSS